MANRDVSFSLLKLQESILKEFKRVSYEEVTPQYEYDSIYYSEISPALPANISKHHHKAIVLHHHHLCEMFNFAIFDFLFVGEGGKEQKKAIIGKLKKTICDQNFMLGSNYIKGLLVKGLRVLSSGRIEVGKPIAQVLMENEAMNAFSQFWKEIAEEQQEYEAKKVDFSYPQSTIFQSISNYLGIDFNLFWKRGNNYEEEIIYSTARNIEEAITIIIIEPWHKPKSILNEVLQQQSHQMIQQHPTNYRYEVLVDLRDHQENVDKYKEMLMVEVDDRDKMVQLFEMSEFKKRREAVVTKGNELVGKFKSFYIEISQK